MESESAGLNSASVETIFHAALALSAAEREQYLDSACGDNSRLRQRIRALLTAHESPDGFLPEQSDKRIDLPILSPPDSEPAAKEKPGDKIGRYKLLQSIGEGGCGVVYMAEQEEPVKRRVALKVIKLGMDTKQVVARFEAERQALALMDHTNIAKVLDAGATETGRPFFVMELVRGTKITDYCDQNRLPTLERLRLFVQVCRAIEHAHQKGIIHRDIKPSNVLVTLHDGVPVPKVIDFGIAKATQGRLTDRTLFTAFEQFIGTPAYMSPEQAEMSGLDVDTRSDIYSLGVLLYELLTGKPPFDPKKLMASGLDAMRQTIREREPTRPSTMLSTMLDGELAAAARSRSVEPPKLISSIEGDLEWIVMKCLEKDRTRRYETASAVAAEIQRFQDNEPVLARPPSRLYLFQKLVRRHKLLVTSTAAVTAAVLIGLSLSTWLWLRERKSAKAAAAEAAKSQQVTLLLQEMLRGAGPAVALGRDTSVLREGLSNTVQRVVTTLTNSPGVQAELLLTIGPVYSDLADFDQAEKTLRRALALFLKRYGTNSLEAARAYAVLSIALWQQGNSVEAEEAQRKALLLYEKLLGPEDVAVARSLHALGQMVAGQGREGEAVDYYRRALRIRQNYWGAEHPEVAESMIDVADTLNRVGGWEEAEILYRKALAMDTKLLPPNDPAVATVLHTLAQLLNGHHKAMEAEVLFRQAIEIRAKVFGEEHPLVADSRTTLGTVLFEQSKLAEAEEQAKRALASHMRLVNSEHSGIAATVTLLIELLMSQHRESEIEDMFKGLHLGSNWSGLRTAELMSVRGNYLARIGRWQEAEAIFTKLVELHPKNHYYYHPLAALLVQVHEVERYRILCDEIRTRFRGKTNAPDLADRMAKDCLILPLTGVDRSVETELAQAAVTLGRNLPAHPWFEFCKGLAEYRQGHWSAAIDWMRKVLETEKDNPQRAVEAYMVLAMAQQASAQPDVAHATLAKGLDLDEKHPRGFGTSEHSWIDWIFAQALKQEAQTLILGTQSVNRTNP